MNNSCESSVNAAFVGAFVGILLSTLVYGLYYSDMVIEQFYNGQCLQYCDDAKPFVEKNVCYCSDGKEKIKLKYINGKK